MVPNKRKSGWLSRIRAEITAIVREWLGPHGWGLRNRRPKYRSKGLKEKDILGINGERYAVKYLKKNGYGIRETNLKFFRGEIDIIAQKNNLLIFVEVKTRKTAEFGLPYDAVSDAKRRNIISMAEYYLYKNRLADYAVRFDVISIVWPDRKKPILEHYESAFDATEFYMSGSKYFR